MENEENRGLINKKISEDQLVHFFHFSFGAPSLYSLSLTLGHLEFSWSILAMDQRRTKNAKGSKNQEKKSNIKQLQRDYLQVSNCMCDFLSRFGMHGTCMCVLGSLVAIGMGFSRCDSVFRLALLLLDRHGVVEFSCLV